MKNITLTANEAKTVKSLIRLGDSETLAIETVIAERSKNNNSEIYEQAYYS